MCILNFTRIWSNYHVSLWVTARLLISWFELVHPIHGSADRIFRWVDEQSLTEKHDSYSIFVWNLECTFKTCKSKKKPYLLIMDSSTYLTPLPWNGLVPCYIYKPSQPSVARVGYSSMDHSKMEDGISLCVLWMWYQLQRTQRDSWTRNWIRTSFLW